MGWVGRASRTWTTERERGKIGRSDGLSWERKWGVSERWGCFGIVVETRTCGR